MDKNKIKLGIIMAGGGARAAYQIGVLKAISEITPRKSPCPFTIICGTSAGAINAAALAAKTEDFRHAVRRMYSIWSGFTANQVFRTDALGVIKTGAHWLLTMMFGGFGSKGRPIYLLDRKPLRRLLERYIDSGIFQAGIEANTLHALSINTTGYFSHQAISFYQGNPSLRNWNRSQRLGAATRITVDHLMASSAIPFLFAPVKINREYFGDGSIRQTAPISPALHLGSDRILVIGNRMELQGMPERIQDPKSPSIGEIAGHTLNSIFLDNLDADIERLQRINRTISLIPEDKRDKHGINLREVEVLVITPSEDFGKIAQQYAHELPWTIRTLMRGIGAYSKVDSSLISYLLFEKGYCNALIDLGYKDTKAQEENIRHFLRDSD